MPEPEEQENQELDPGFVKFIQGIVREELREMVPHIVEALRNQLPTQTAAPEPAPPPVPGYSDVPASQDVTGAQQNIGGPIIAMVMELLRNPVQLGQIAQTALGTYVNFKQATRPDDTTVLREIAARNPQIMQMFAPDPYGGAFPQIMANTYLKGMQVASTARGAAAGAPLISPSDNPFGEPIGASPGASVTPTGTPATTVAPSPISANGETPGDTFVNYRQVPTKVLDMAIADIILERKRRDQNRISVVAE